MDEGTEALYLAASGSRRRGLPGRQRLYVGLSGFDEIRIKTQGIAALRLDGMFFELCRGGPQACRHDPTSRTPRSGGGRTAKDRTRESDHAKHDYRPVRHL